MGFFCLEGLLLDSSKEGETRLEAHRGYAPTAFRTLSRHGVSSVGQEIYDVVKCIVCCVLMTERSVI
jgi:hypothetical protein